MARKQLVSFKNPEDTPAFGGVTHYKNPRYWKGEVPAWATHIYTDNKEILNAYLERGVVELKSEPIPAKEVKQEESNISDKWDLNGLPESEDKADASAGVDPSQMSWPELRSYASSLTDEPIKNKQVALEVIERLG